MNSMMDPAPFSRGGTYNRHDTIGFICLNGLLRCVSSTMNGTRNLAKAR